MNGVELCRLIKSECPNIGVLLISANCAHAGKVEFPFLAKPFTPEALRIAVAKVLEGTLPPGRG
jgi:CheY-like chemotaxis protein